MLLHPASESRTIQILENAVKYLSPNLSNSLTIQIRNGKTNSNNLMILKSLNQNSTHQR
jgi:hypothetical protein